MAIDVGRVVQAALEAATQAPSSDGEAKTPKPHLSGGRALLLGAGLVTVGRLAAPKGREMLGSLQERLEESEADGEDEELETDEDYDDEPQGEADDDDEPQGEADEDFDEEDDYDEEPEGENDEDFDEEDGDEDERPRPRRRTRSRVRSRS
jgi:hypothetical protein